MENAVVLFSGGRDSSLATCLLAKQGMKIHLLSTFNGAVVKGEVCKYRFKELKTAFPDNIILHKILPSFGLFRKLALQDIEADFAKYKFNLIPVGDAIATHTIAILYCLQNQIGTIASGYVRYEDTFPEQYTEVVEITKRFVQEYNLKYLTPVFKYDSVNKVKYDLFDFGISTKSLEGISIFADTYSVPPTEIVLEYVQNKFIICREYIEKMLSNKID